MRLIFEALKIDKMPRARLVHVWFFILFLISAAAYLTMPTGGQLDLFQQELNAFFQRQGFLPFPPPAWFSLLFRQLGLLVISLWFILLYAVHWLFASSEVTGEALGADEDKLIPPLPSLGEQTPSQTALRAFPVLLLLALAMIVPYLISLPAMGIPFYVLVTMLSMTIFVYIIDKKTIPAAMESSYQMTLGMKFFIFASFIFLNSITSIISDLLRLLFTDNLWAGSLIRAFFFALKTLAFGRLAAIFYRSLAARQSMIRDGSLDGL